MKTITATFFLLCMTLLMSLHAASVFPASGPTTGGPMIFISAEGAEDFGMQGLNGAVQFGPHIVTISSWSSSLITFTLPEGVGNSLSIVITLDDLTVIQVSNTFSYFAPSLNTITPGNGPTNGLDTMTLTGTNFGPPSTPATVLFDTTEYPAAIHVSHNQLIFLIPPGTGVNISVRVKAGGQLSNPFFFSYHGPQLSAISPNPAPTTGGPCILTGANFGPSGTSAIVHFGTQQASNVIVIDHDSISCTIPPGTGMNIMTTVTIGTLSSLVPVAFSYAPPVISQIDPDHGSPVGSTLVTLTGQNFGPPGTTAMVTVGGIQVTNVTVIGHDSITFLTLPGFGMNKPVQATVNLQPSNPVPYSYDLPLIQDVSPPSGPTEGGFTLTLIGQNFGNPPAPLTVLMNGVPAFPFDHISDTQFSFTCPPGWGDENSIALMVAGQSGNQVNFAYNAPAIVGMNPLSGPESGGTEVTLTGTNFGPSNASVTIHVGSQSALNIVHNGHSSISFTTPPGTGSQPVSLAVGDQSATGTFHFIYNPPPDTTAVGIGTTAPDASAKLDIVSLEKGILIPRLTTAQRMAISEPAAGLLVYDSTENAFYYFNGTVWKALVSE